MKLTIVEPNKAFPNGYLEIDDARILWPNFEGRGDRFNKQGERNFHVIIPEQEIASALMNDKSKYGDGWNVKIKKRDEGEAPFMNLKVKVSFNGRGPNIYLITGNPGDPRAKKVLLNEDTVKMLDYIDIVSCDMDIRPYDGEMPNGQTFRTAYLSNMRVYQRVDRFSAADDEYFDALDC